MKFNTKIPGKLKVFYDLELSLYASSLNEDNLQKAWTHLERAHILGQKYPVQHTSVHWKMLQFGFRIKSGKEIIGQIPRLLVGGVKSFIGKIPVGNPGGANVPALKSFPIDEELQGLFLAAEVTD